MSVPALHFSADYPFESHFASVTGYRMHYVDEGKGKPLLFLHGNPGWSYIWRNVIPHLTDLGRCVAPDQIGMGRSDKPLIDYDFHRHLAFLEEFASALSSKFPSARRAISSRVDACPS